jgi:hypothetical protein
MRLVPSLLVAAAALSAAFAPAGAAAAPPAQEKITIDAWSKGVFGYVESRQPQVCSAQRRVTVYEQSGEQHDPGADRRVGSSLARKTRGGYQWSLRGTGAGVFYATTAARGDCPGASSRTFSKLPGRVDDPRLCNPNSGPGWCRLNWPKPLHFQSERCTSFTKSSGDCNTGEPGGDANYPFADYFGSDLHGELQWWTADGLRQVRYFTHTGADNVGISHIAGTLPNAGSDRFTVTDAYAQRSGTYGDGPHFETPVVAGAGPGDMGGPLGFNFDASTKIIFGSEDIYMWGWLYRK